MDNYKPLKCPYARIHTNNNNKFMFTLKISIITWRQGCLPLFIVFQPGLSVCVSTCVCACVLCENAVCSAFYLFICIFIYIYTYIRNTSLLRPTFPYFALCFCEPLILQAYFYFRCSHICYRIPRSAVYVAHDTVTTGWAHWRCGEWQSSRIWAEGLRAACVAPRRVQRSRRAARENINRRRARFWPQRYRRRLGGWACGGA